MLKFSIITFGCQMNEYDSKLIENLLIHDGMVKASDPETAEVVILNTCSVREKPEKKAIETAKYFKKRGKFVILTGCTAQQKGEELLEVSDAVVGTRNFSLIPEIVKKKITNSAFLDLKKVCTFNYLGRSISKVLEYVVIQEGCDNFCTYCVVPYTRGREYSRSPEEILSELRYLEDQGVREVTLLGQNVNSYFYKGMDFADLLSLIDAEINISRIYFTTSHPRDMSKKVIRTVKGARVLKPWFHLPLQSGSTRVLKDMNRNYTKEEFISLCEYIRSEIPEASITTDIMVGFPTETEEDFLDTIDVVEKVKFDNAFMFIYSPRNPSAAYVKFKGKILNESESNKRLRKLISVVNKNILERRKGMLGREYTVLVHGTSRKGRGFSKGKTENNITVVVRGTFLEGEFVKVKIVNIKGLTPIGEPV